MIRRTKILLGLGVAIVATLGGAGAVYAVQADASAQLRASGQAGEQADGYLGVVGNAGGDVRAQVEAVNIKRRALYTDLAAKRGVKIEEAAASTACEIFKTRVAPGQYYRLTDGVWRKRDSTPIPLPSYCG
jgi:uncharacterized protein YdbL (DUF1318 family)